MSNQDNAKGYKAPTRSYPQNEAYQTSLLEASFRYFMGAVLINVFAVSFWRGGWVLMDHYMDWPENMSTDDTSAWSLGIAAVLYVSLIPAMSWLAKRFQHIYYLRVFLEGVFVWLLGIGSIALWRGLWYLFDEHLLTSDKEASGWLNHVLGALGSILMLSFHSMAIGPVPDLSPQGVYLPSWDMKAHWKHLAEARHHGEYNGKSEPATKSPHLADNSSEDEMTDTSI